MLPRETFVLKARKIVTEKIFSEFCVKIWQIGHYF
jgi:hypothetical protein